MTDLCLIAPIGLHPRFVRVRPLRFRHEDGGVIARTHGFDEPLDRLAVLQRLRDLDRTVAAHDRAGDAYAAIQARSDRRDLDLAWREMCAFRRRVCA